MTLAFSPQGARSPQPRFRPIRVLALTGDVRAAERAHALGLQEGIEVQTIPANMPQLAEQLLSHRDADIILADVDLGDNALGPTIEVELARAALRKPLIVCASALPLDATRRLMRMEAAEVVESNSDAGDVATIIYRVLGSRRPQQAAKVTAFFSPRGGVGVSTLAVETAVASAAGGSSNDHGVCLVDLNLEYGICAPLLNLTPSLKSASQLLPSRIDDQLLDAFAVKHKLGLHVLAAENDWTSPETNVEGVTKLLDIAASRFHHLVIDLPKTINQISAAVLGSADNVFIVTDLTVPGLQLTRAAMAALDSRMNANGTMTLIVNRVARRGGGAALSLRDVQRFVPCRRVSVIHEDTEAASEATDRGEPMTRLRPDSRISREILEAVRVVLPASPSEPDGATARSALNLLTIGKSR